MRLRCGWPRLRPDVRDSVGRAFHGRVCGVVLSFALHHESARRCSTFPAYKNKGMVVFPASIDCTLTVNVNSVVVPAKIIEQCAKIRVRPCHTG